MEARGPRLAHFDTSKKKLGEREFAKQIKSRTTEKDRRSDAPIWAGVDGAVNAKFAAL